MLKVFLYDQKHDNTLDELPVTMEEAAAINKLIPWMKENNINAKILIAGSRFGFDR